MIRFYGTSCFSLQSNFGNRNGEAHRFNFSHRSHWNIFLEDCRAVLWKRRLSFNAKLGRLHDFGLFPRRWQSYFAITRHSFTVIGEAVVIDRQHYKEVTAVWTFAVLSGEFFGPDNPFLTMWARNKDHNKIRSKMKSPLISGIVTATDSQGIVRPLLSPCHNVFAVHKTDARLSTSTGGLSCLQPAS